MLQHMAVILVIDDEETVIYLTRATLERAGYSIHTASTGDEGEIIAATLPVIDLLIVDHGVPPDSGVYIAERLVRDRPQMKVMQFSGYPRECLEREGKLIPGAAFLPKPFRPKQLQETVETLLALPDLNKRAAEV